IQSEIIGDVHAGAGMKRPSELPLVPGGSIGLTAGQHVVIGEAVNRIVRHADAGTNVWRDAAPRIEVVVSVGEEQPLGLTSMVLVGAPQVIIIIIEYRAFDLPLIIHGVPIERAEGRLAAVLASQIKAHVIAILVADT